MATLAAERALEVRRQFSLGTFVHNVSLDGILAHYGIHLGYWPFSGRVQEVLYEDWLLLNPHTSSEERRWLKGHALGHRLLHTGNQLFLELTKPVVKAKQEHQAILFAGFLFLGRLEWAWPGMTIYDAASEAMIPVARLSEWCELSAVELKVMSLGL